MKKHITKDHEGGELPFKCDMCEKAFLYETKLNTHKMYVHERNINCEFCDQKFSMSTGLKIHIGRKHNKPQLDLCRDPPRNLKVDENNQEDLKCHICGIIYSDEKEFFAQSVFCQ